MVGHTHQDFLLNETPASGVDTTHVAIDLSEFKDFTHTRDLFDFYGHYERKVSLSFLDEFIDDESDWKKFVKPLTGIDRLYLVNDRLITNRIMKAYAEVLNRKYVARLKQDGIPAIIANPI